MSEIHALEIPKWGMTMNEGTISEWLVSEGSEVSKGTAVVGVESSKISGEIEAPADGVLRRAVGKEGQTYDVGVLIGVLAPASVPEEEIEEFLSSKGAGSQGASSGSGGDAPTGADPEGERRPATDSGATADAAGSKDVSGRDEADQVASARSGAGPASRGEESGTARSDKSEDLRAESGTVSIPENLRGETPEGTGATPHAARLAREHGIDLSQVTPSGRGERVTVADLQRAVEEAGGRLPFGSDRPKVGEIPASGDDAEVPATPIARRVAAEQGINLLSVRPTGRAGRVTRRDVLAAAALQGRVGTGASDTASEAAEDQVAAGQEAAAPQNPGTEIPLSAMRKVIAGRLQASYQESPHFRVTGRARIDELLALRRQVNDHRFDLKLTVNDLVVRAVATALTRVPEVNAQFDPQTQTVTQFEHADVSVAVSTDEGLITPILQRADQLSLGELSTELKDLGTRAKAGTLAPDEFQGGTFTVSNLGMFGVADFDAIINPPQVAILAVAGAAQQFVPDENGEPVAATVLPFTISADHRVVDGAVAARFIRELTTLLENPSLIFA